MISCRGDSETIWVNYESICDRKTKIRRHALFTRDEATLGFGSGKKSFP